MSEVFSDKLLFECWDACFEVQLAGGTGGATVPCMYGPPGGGKTQRIAQYAKWKESYGSKALGKAKVTVHVHSIILGQGTSVDVGGAFAPDFKNGELKHLLIKDILGQIEGIKADIIIIHLDEAGNANSETLTAVQSLLEDGQIRGRKKEKGCVYALSTNRPEDGCGSRILPKSLRNGRLVSFELEPDPQQWLEDFAVPAGIDVRIRAAIEWRGSLLMQHDGKSKERVEATPRGWEKLSNLLKQEPSPAALDKLAPGCVGEGAWREVKGFIELVDELPEYLDIINSPESALIPGSIDSRNGPSGQWAVVTNLAYEVGRLKKNGTVLGYDDASSIAIYLGRLEDEYAIFGARECANANPEFANTKEFSELSVKHSDLKNFRK
jgi:hypothetical protein